MNSKTVASSAGDGDKPLCIACGSSLPTPVSSGQSETIDVISEPAEVLELEELSAKRSQAPLAEPEKLDEQSPALAQSDKKSEIEIRLVLADCVCGRPKLALEEETMENQDEIPDSMAHPIDAGDQAISVDESDEKKDLRADLDSNPLNFLVEISEGRKNDESELNICQFWGNNWRQFTSVLPGLFLLLTLGAHNVFTIYELDQFTDFGYSAPLLKGTKNFKENGISSSPYDSSPYRNNYNSYSYRHMTSMDIDYGYASYSDDTTNRSSKDDRKSFLVIVMWFVGAIVGNVIGAVFVRNLKKRTIYYLAALLQITAGFLFFLLRHQQFNARLPIVQLTYRSLMLDEFTLGVAARLVSGIVSGLVYLTVTVHASDIASKRMRRVISYAIVMIIAFSTLIYSTVHEKWYIPHTSFYTDLLSFDYNMMALGLIVLLLNPLFTNETVPYYLTRGKVSKAQKKFVELSGERSGEPSAGTLEKFDELQLMVQEDQENGRNIFGGGNLKPLFTVLCARLLRLFVMNASTVMLVMSATKTLLSPHRSFDGGFLIELSAIQISIGSISLALAACLGRHKFFYISAILMVTSTIGLAYLDTSFIARAALLATFVHLSLGLDYYQQKQSADAFTVTKKASSLAMIAFFEHSMNVVLIARHITYAPYEGFTLIYIAAGIIVLSIVLLATVPETKKMSLRETRNKFNQTMAGIVTSAV